jgi:hypothetical protein
MSGHSVAGKNTRIKVVLHKYSITTCMSVIRAMSEKAERRGRSIQQVGHVRDTAGPKKRRERSHGRAELARDATRASLDHVPSPRSRVHGASRERACRDPRKSTREECVSEIHPANDMRDVEASAHPHPRLAEPPRRSKPPSSSS